MKTESKGKRPRARIWLLLFILAGAGLMWALFSQTQLLRGQTNTPAPKPSPVFTPAHSSVSEAFRHFVGIRPKPQQPIAYTHTVHIHQAGLQCNFCHVGVEKGPIASIPGVSTCTVCHDEEESASSPERKKIFEYQKKGEDIPWQRVYGWVEESHVKFNHAPHIRAKVECATCHGDVANMTVAEKVVDHTMGFCIKCHEQKKAPNDCMTCHY